MSYKSLSYGLSQDLYSSKFERPNLLIFLVNFLLHDNPVGWQLPTTAHAKVVSAHRASNPDRRPARFPSTVLFIAIIGVYLIFLSDRHYTTAIRYLPQYIRHYSERMKRASNSYATRSIQIATDLNTTNR
jgi:hypothetical protein